MKTIGKIIDGIFTAVKWVVTILFAILVVLVFMQVFYRYVLNASITWSTEIANYSMMWIALLGAALLVRNHGHMAIDNLLGALKGVPQKVLTGISVGLQFAFIIAWIYGCIVFLPTVRGQYSPALHLSLFLVDSVFPITGVLMFLAEADYWLVNKGKEGGYSEEDELLKRVKEEAAQEQGEGAGQT